MIPDIRHTAEAEHALANVREHYLPAQLCGWSTSNAAKSKVFLLQDAGGFTIRDLRPQLRDWHREVNPESPCHATGIVPAVRLGEEALQNNVK